jgi:hypothetical protein
MTMEIVVPNFLRTSNGRQPIAARWALIYSDVS